MNGGRVATASGAILADAALVEGSATGLEPFFEPDFWSANGRITPVDRGRGAAWFIDRGTERGTEQWVLRHYRRGGLMARVSADRYLWAGESRVRAFAEFRLLAALVALGMPVPVPIAARYARQGVSYRCDLITRRIAGAGSLSGVLAASPLSDVAWKRIGSTIARFHAAGADHADLNAHNILLDDRGTVSIVDFDRGRCRPPGAWAERNLRRLRRSLDKISADLPADRFPGDAWRSLEEGYSDARDL